MIEWVGFTAILFGIISGYLALKNLNSVFKPITKKRANPFVFQFYKKTSFGLIIVGVILLIISYLDFQSWSQETNLKVTAYSLIVALIASVYAIAQTAINNRRLRDIEQRIKNRSDNM